MKFNRRAQALMGVGATGVSVDGKLIRGAAGKGCWLTDDLIIANCDRGDGTFVLMTMTIDGVVQQTLDRGANFLAAGGGRWIASNPGQGTFGSLPPDPLAGALGAGPDGTLAYCPNYGLGYGLELAAPGQAATAGPADADVQDIQVVGPGQALWYEGPGKIRTLGIPQPTFAQSPFQTRRAVYAGRVWLLYWTPNFGVVLQEDGATTGYVLLDPSQPAYNRDLVAVDGGSLYVGWSKTQGEGPNDLVKFPMDFTLSQVDLVDPPPPTVPTFSFNHPVLVAPFKDPNNASGALAEVVVNQNDQNPSTKRPLVLAEDCLDSRYQGELLGLYSEATDPSAVLKEAEARSTRLMLAHDAISNWTPPVGLRTWDQPWLELYLNGAESLSQTVARWHKQMQALLAAWPHDVGVIPMFYVPGTWTEQQVLDGLNHLSEIVNLSSRVKLIAPFEYQRANGIVAHDDGLMQAWHNLLDEQHRVGVATLTPVEKPTPPTPKPEPFILLEAVHMDQQKVALVGPNGLYGTVNKLTPTVLEFSKTAVGVDETWTLAPADGDARKRYTLVPDNAADSVLGVDTTQYGSNDVRKLFYLKPKSGGVGNYELFEVRKDPVTGLFIAYIAYVDQGVQTKPYAAPNLTVVAL